jgi:hypothetical protein
MTRVFDTRRISSTKRFMFHTPFRWVSLGFLYPDR